MPTGSGARPPQRGAEAARDVAILCDFPLRPDTGVGGAESELVELLMKDGLRISVDSLKPSRAWIHPILTEFIDQPVRLACAALKQYRECSPKAVQISRATAWLAFVSLKIIGARCVLMHRSHGVEGRREMCFRRSAGSRRPHRSAVTRLAEWIVGRWRYFQSFLTARLADVHLVPSTLCANFLADTWGVPKTSIVVLRPLAPSAYLNVPAPEMSQERNRRILCVGRLSEDKDPKTTSESAVHILSQERAATFNWVTDRTLPTDLEEILRPVWARVTVEMWQDAGTLMRTYDTHGILLMPSMFDGFGRVALEAMSRGMCVIVSSESGVSTIIESGRDGIVTPAADYGAVVAACLELMHDPARARHMSARARERAAAYDAEASLSQVSALYPRLLEQPMSRWARG
jgi:glycosyltransferase involved in cell wall biosynthesis